MWAARHLPTGATRALKVLIGPCSPEEIARFQREGEAQARVDLHENIVRVHATGVDAGRPWLSMDLAAGGDLASRLSRGALPAAEAASIVRALALGLAHVHARGVLHRDLKPSNVLFDREGTPRLVDFGLARVAGADTLTSSGTVMGTPAYMSPEQARGERVDERSDVYGLGAILYHALAGRPPFEGSTPLGVLRLVVSTRPAPPSRFTHGVPSDLEAACMHALAPDPAQRFASAGDLARAIDGCLKGKVRGRWFPRLLCVSCAVVIGLGLLVAGPCAPTTASSGVGAVHSLARFEDEREDRLTLARRLALGSAERPPDAPAARRLLEELEEVAAPAPKLRLALTWAHVVPGGLERALRYLRSAPQADLRERLLELEKADAAASVFLAIAACEGYGGPADRLQGLREVARLAREGDDETRALAIRWLRHAAVVGDSGARSQLRRLREGSSLPPEEAVDPRDLLGFDGSTLVPVPTTVEASADAKAKHQRALQVPEQGERARRLLALTEELGYAGSHVELGQLWSASIPPDLPLALRHYALGAIDAAEMDAYGCPRGCSWAWLRLGWAYLFGIGCEVDLEEAHRCLDVAERRLPKAVGPRIHGLEIRLWTAIARLSGRGIALDRAAGMSELERVLSELAPHEMEEIGPRLRLAADREAWSAWLFGRVAQVLEDEERASCLVRAEREGVTPATAAIASWSRGDPAREAIVQRLRRAPGK